LVPPNKSKATFNDVDDKDKEKKMKVSRKSINDWRKERLVDRIKKFE